MGIRYQASTNTKQVAALFALGVALLPPDQLDGGDPVTRFFTEANPYNPRNPDDGGQLQWLLESRSVTGHATESLMDAWEHHREADAELDAFVESLDADIRAILKRLIPRAMMAAIRAGMYNWTDLATAAKKATKMVAFRDGDRFLTAPLDYSKGVADKFGLPYPNPALKQKR
jgi:hypothetical protein